MFLKVVKIALYVMLTQCSLCNANVEVNIVMASRLLQ